MTKVVMDTTKKATVLLSSLLTNFILFFSFIYPGAIAQLMNTNTESLDKAVGLGVIYGTFVIGFLARPLGSLFFGWVADKYSKTIVTRFSLLCCLASLVSLISFSANNVSFILLILARILQGATLGGQIHSSLANCYEVFLKYNSRISCGVLTAFNFFGAFTAIVCSEMVDETTWKIPLYGAVGLVSLAFILSEASSNILKGIKENITKSEFKTTGFLLSKGTFITFAIQAFPFFIFYETIIYSSYEESPQFLNLKIIFSLLVPISLATFSLIDNYLPKKQTLIVCMLSGSTGLLFHAFIEQNSWSNLFFIILMAVCIAGYLSTIMDILPSFFPPQSRVLNLAVASESSSIMFAGLLPYLVNTFEVPLVYPYILIFFLTIYLLKVMFFSQNAGVFRCMKHI